MRACMSMRACLHAYLPTYPHTDPPTDLPTCIQRYTKCTDIYFVCVGCVGTYVCMQAGSQAGRQVGIWLAGR